MYTSLLFCSTVKSSILPFLSGGLLLAVGLLLKSGLGHLSDRRLVAARLCLALGQRFCDCGLAFLFGELLDGFFCLSGLLLLLRLLLLLLLFQVSFMLLLIDFGRVGLIFAF